MQTKVIDMRGFAMDAIEGFDYMKRVAKELKNYRGDELVKVRTKSIVTGEIGEFELPVEDIREIASRIEEIEARRK